MSAPLLSLGQPHQCHLLRPAARPGKPNLPIPTPPPNPELRFLSQVAPILATMKQGKSTQTGALIHVQGSRHASSTAHAGEGCTLG